MTHQGWKAQIIHIDYFGNLGTNLRLEHLQDKDVRCGCRTGNPGFGKDLWENSVVNWSL
jgi:S-adenosylmethionine hydrolase